ncbi:MBL fold metallo-hydrolase [Proteocatella sphenisci]|uniref:MBL fold metallo-hydrolase n=1 Tax=Proteocatella sphenisci TaxID=181070 RepID=UPI00048A4F31|nr:MBL fold metallo-hydrolase [Proteocatella sphenisci]
MVEKIYDKPEIYRVIVPLPENPLRNLNSYLIKSDKRNLVIDTGFNRDECYSAMIEAFEELEIKISETDFFITHLHGDHCGIVGRLAGDQSKIFMGETDYKYLIGDIEGVSWDNMEIIYEHEGFPSDVSERLSSTNQARKYMPDRIFKALTMSDGDIIKLGNYEFRCILTPGHTPGHMCLYLENEKLLFSGDHVLFDITPNITSWQGVEDSLEDYMKSLEMIKNLDVNITFAGHRESRGKLSDRVDEILEHHRIRLEDTIKILKDLDRPLNAYEITQRMKWNLRGISWQEFPDNQKWFAMGETMSHIDYLVKRDVISKKYDKDSGIYLYSLS